MLIESPFTTSQFDGKYNNIFRIGKQFMVIRSNNVLDLDVDS